MAHTDWNVINSYRDYPFCPTDNSNLPSDAILDCKFFIINPEILPPKVWLHSYLKEESRRIFVFKNTDNQEMTFYVPDSEEWQCIWNTNDPAWYGFVVFGKAENS
ncbi:MAG: hypothetical protein Q4D38_00130 [Planctomycetia bacterium]|nr:hypothetical protein [Planctomycetia bacterium]